MVSRVPNQSSPLADVRPGSKGLLQAFIANPWSNFFQSFTQAAPAAVPIVLTGSPFVYTTGESGTLYITGGTISNISLIRGTTIINLTGQRQIPMGVKDSVSVTYSVAPVVQFLGAQMSHIVIKENAQIVTIREKVFAAEAYMRTQPQIELKVVNYFSYGVYARELHIPAGVTLTGEIHKLENLNILSKGRMKVLTENGIQEVEAPFTVVSPPGTKRIAYAITDCVWTTVHGTFDRDVDKIKQTFIATTEQEYLEYCGHISSQLELDLH